MSFSSNESSDSNDSSSSYASLDSVLDTKLATYHVVWKNETAMGSAACSAGTIKITLAEPTEEESEEEESTEATAPSSPPSFRVTDMVPCIAYFDYGEWRCTFNCIQKSALDNFSEFVLDKTKKVMKRDTESQELYPVGILDGHGHELLKFETDRRHPGCAPVTVTLWLKRGVGDKGEGREELTSEEIEALNLEE